MLASLIGAFISGEALNAARRARNAAIAYAFVGLLVLTGLGFLTGAAYVAASRRWGSLEAAIGFGLVFLLVAVLILVVRWIAGSVRRSRAKRRGADIATIAGAAAVTALPLLLKSRLALVAPLLGIVAYAIYREQSRRPGGFDE